MTIYYATGMVREEPRFKNLETTQYESAKWEEKYKRGNALFYVCSLVEEMARLSFNSNVDIVNLLGVKIIDEILKNAELLHNQNLQITAQEMLKKYSIKSSNYSLEKYSEVPSSYTFADPVSKAILYIIEKDKIVETQAIICFYNSPIMKLINNFDVEMHLSNVQYIYESYKAKRALEY